MRLHSADHRHPREIGSFGCQSAIDNPQLAIMTRTRDRWLGWGILATLAAYAASRGPLLPEMLWSCHAATALVGLGLVLGSRRMVAAGFLFHAALGLPGFLLLVAAKQWFSAEIGRASCRERV